MESCVRKIHFSYGHRVMNHESKCASLHGHNGVVWVYARPINGLDSLGRVVDFSVLKEKLGGWIDSNWDHTMILSKDDTSVINAVQGTWQKRPAFLLPNNPTAENMAKYLLYEICPIVLKGKGIVVHKIGFFETENSYVEESIDSFDDSLLNKYR